MGKKVRIQLAPEDRDWLEALIANGNTPQKHVRRARIVLLAGDDIGTDEIQRRLRVSKPTIRLAHPLMTLIVIPVAYSLMDDFVNLLTRVYMGRPAAVGVEPELAPSSVPTWPPTVTALEKPKVGAGRDTDPDVTVKVISSSKPKERHGT